MSRYKLSVLALLVLVLGFLFTFGTMSVADEGIAVGVQVGQKAPDFTLPRVDVDGEKLNLYELVSQYDAVFLCFFLVST